MDREKLIYFLDVNSYKTLQRPAMKTFLMFDIFISMIIISLGILIFGFFNTLFNIVNVIFVAMSILFFTWYKLTKNTLLYITYNPSIIVVTTIKLFYGYWLFAKSELVYYDYPIFTWLHMMFMFVFVSFAMLMYYAHIKLYIDTKKLTFQDLKKRETGTLKKAASLRKSRPWLIIPFVVFQASPYVVSKFLDDFKIRNGLGIGFAMWSLGCIWFFLLSCYLPKMIVFMKYKSMLQ